MTPVPDLMVLGVPGMLDHRPDADPRAVAEQRATDWRALLQRGIHTDLPTDWRPRYELKVRMAVYAHLLREPRPIAHGHPGAHPQHDPEFEPDLDRNLERDLGRLDPGTAALLVEMAAGIPDDAFPDVPQGRLTELVHAIKALARDSGVTPGRFSRYAKRYLSDVDAYLDPANQSRRHDARAFVVDELLVAVGEGRPISLVIGHDLGALVAYEALADPRLAQLPKPEWPGLMTLGAPLGLRSVFDRLNPPPVDGCAAWPAAARSWIDVHAERDRLAMDRPLTCWYACAGREFADRPVGLGSRRHVDDADTYLASQPVAERLRQLLSDGPGAVLNPRPVAGEPVVPQRSPGPAPARQVIDLAAPAPRADLVKVLCRLPLRRPGSNGGPDDGIRGVLDDIRFPDDQYPSMDRPTDEVWRDVLDRIDAGVMKDGYATLLNALAGRYPGNEVLSVWRGRLADRQGEFLPTERMPPP